MTFIQPTVFVLYFQPPIQLLSLCHLCSPSLYQTSEVWILLLSLVVKPFGQLSKLQPFSIQLRIWQHQLYPASLREISCRDLVTHNWSAWQPLVLSSFFTVNSLFIHFTTQPEKTVKIRNICIQKSVLCKLSSSFVIADVLQVAIRQMGYNAAFSLPETQLP